MLKRLFAKKLEKEDLKQMRRFDHQEREIKGKIKENLDTIRELVEELKDFEAEKSDLMAERTDYIKNLITKYELSSDKPFVWEFDTGKVYNGD